GPRAGRRRPAGRSRRPVKLPGPVPTSSPCRSALPTPLSRTSSSTCSSTRTARETRSPSTSPSRTSAEVATLVAVSNASVSTPGQAVEQGEGRAVQRDQSPGGVHVRQTYLHPHRPEGAPRPPAPL